MPSGRVSSQWYKMLLRFGGEFIARSIEYGKVQSERRIILDYRKPCFAITLRHRAQE